MLKTFGWWYNCWEYLAWLWIIVCRNWWVLFRSMITSSRLVTKSQLLHRALLARHLYVTRCWVLLHWYGILLLLSSIALVTYFLARSHGIICLRACILSLWFKVSGEVCALLYTLLVSFFFLFLRLISEVTERVSTMLGHIFTYDCYLKYLVRTPPRHLPPLVRGKNCFLIPTLNFDQTYLCNRTWYQQSEILFKLWSRNGWEWLASFCLPLNFSIRRHCQLYRMDASSL